MKSGRQDAIRRRLWGRWTYKGGEPLRYKRLASYWANWEKAEYHRGVVDEMREYKERLVAEKLKDQEFKRDLETARENLRGARKKRDVAWEVVEALRPAADRHPAWPEVWASYVEAADAYSSAKRRSVDALRSKFGLNQGWVLWLDNYLETGQNKSDKLQLYRMSVREDECGGRYISIEVYFPLSRAMLAEINYWVKFNEDDAFGGFYEQRTGGGRPPGESEKKRRRYLELARDYHETAKQYQDLGERPLTEEEFCVDRGISVRTLRRALRMYHDS